MLANGRTTIEGRSGNDGPTEGAAASVARAATSQAGLLKFNGQYYDVIVASGNRLNVRIKMRHHDAWVLGGTANPPDVAAETGTVIDSMVLPDKGDLTVTVVFPQVAKLDTHQSSPGNHDADIQAAVQN